MITIGCDPSLTATGLAVLDGDTLKAGRCLHLKPVNGDMRLLIIADEIVELLKHYRAGVFGIEENHVTPGKSPQSALKQREVLGAVIQAVARADWPIVRVAPTQAKAALTGSGSADKAAMVRHAELQFRLNGKQPKYWKEAVADAIGVALVAQRSLRPGTIQGGM